MRILVADDEEKLRSVVASYLEREGFNIRQAANGREAMAAVQQDTFNLVILDLMMPEIDGWSVLRELRKESNVPVILLTARGDEVDRVLGLELGADDYVTKPFSPRELVARVKAVLRRTEPPVMPEQVTRRSVLVRGPLVVDVDTREVRLRKTRVDLTPKEFDLLVALARTPGRVWSREAILDHVWGHAYFGDTRVVDTNINRLRDKLSRASKDALIKTVWGVGYKFEVEADDQEHHD
ncbi:MAG: response regulator transcription factor [Bacillota bacterium]